jgi:hypothetical protein
VKKALGLLSLFALLAGCVTWTEDSQGNLKSFGVPGVPVWTAKEPPKTPESGNSATTGPPPLDPQTAELTIGGDGRGIWLNELNRWREMSGVQPVGENTDLTKGSLAHARYLVKQGPSGSESFVAYTDEMGAAGHTEDATSQWYSPEGAEAASGGKRAYGVFQAADVSFGKSEAEDIQLWLVSPFHRFSLLSPSVSVAGYGAFGDYPQRASALALRGVTQQGTDAELVEFPPEGASFAIATMDAREWPNPLTSCPGYSPPVGLPISLQMGRQIKLQSYSLRDITKDRAVEACAFDAATYENSDLVAERRARETLKIYGAIVLIPRHALVPGHHYRVEVKTLRHTVNWSFAIAAERQKYASGQ